MKFTISSSIFAGQLKIAGMALAKKNPMPILDCFHIEVKEGVMMITASNAENSIITKVPLIDNQGEGVMCIKAETLMRAMSEIPDQPLLLEYDENSSELKGQYSGGEFSIVGMEADIFPPSVPVNEGSEITLSSRELIAGVSLCLIATEEDELYVFKRGVFFDIRKDSLILVATDGRKLVKKTLPGVKPGFEGGLLLPMKIAGILKGLTKKDCPATITFDQMRATISIDDTTVYFRLLDARFPNYNSVIPAQRTIKVLLERQALIGALKRVRVFSDHSNNFIKFELRQNEAIVTGQDLNYETSGEEVVPCDYDGAPFSIGFASTIFVEILNNIDTDNVILEMLAPERPCVCKPSGVEDDLLMLLMPMKIE